MKKTQEIIGLPIISISDGLEVGRVKSIIINADKGSIEYIVVDNGIQILSARVIPTDSILGIGEYAVTIESDSSINDISKIPAAIDLLQKNIQVKGTKVLTKKGRLIGEIGDIYVDENDCCVITGLEYIADITQKRIRLIPRESIITFGKNLIIVAEDVENKLVDTVSQLGSIDQTEDEKKNLDFSDINTGSNYLTEEMQDVEVPVLEVIPAVEVPADTLIADFNPIVEVKDTTETNDFPVTSISVSDSEQEILEAENDVFDIGNINEAVALNSDEEVLLEPAPEQTEAQLQEDIDTTEVNAASLFEQRQKQYLNGRRATKTIADNNGNVIVSEGMVINNEIIEIAKNAGKLIELVMNNKA